VFSRPGGAKTCESCQACDVRLSMACQMSLLYSHIQSTSNEDTLVATDAIPWCGA